MAARRAAPRPTRRSAAPQPKGARVPHPQLVLWLARGIVLAALALFCAAPQLLTWAAHERLALAGQQPDVASLLAGAVPALLKPAWVRAAGWIGVSGVYLMLAELVLGVWGQSRQRRALPRMPASYLMVRAPLPSVGLVAGRATSTATPSGDQFFRALARALPAGTRRERFAGTAPWVALTLTGLPDQPVELGVVIADHDSRRRAETAHAIRAIIQGQLPGVQVDMLPDPLAAALRAGAQVAWREYGLRLPPQYPLRFLDDIAGSDLLGPLAAALAPRGVERTEAQMTLRPAHHWALNWGWRGSAMALKLRLEAKDDYALADDARRIEAKLAATPFELSLRIVAVGAEAAGDRLTAALNEVAQVLGAYSQGTSHQVQSLIQIGAGRAQIRAAAPALVVHNRAPRFAPPPALLLPLRPWRQPDIASSLEVAGLWHPPSAGLGALIRWLPCTVLPPPPHAFIAPDRDDRIMVGRARRADGTVGPVGPTLRDIRPPLHITAGMGAGKSRALANICQQCLPYGFTLLDGKGDDQGGSLASTVRSLIPLADEARLILFDILDTDWPIGLNPLTGIDVAQAGAKDQALSQIMAIFARLDPSTWGKAPAMKEFVQMATLLVLEGEPQPTLAHVKQCLLDAAYRERLIPQCTNLDVLTFWTVTFPTQGEQQRSSLHALLRRFSQLLTTETTRYMVSQPASRLNLLDAIERGLIILAPLPHVTLGDLASAVGMLLLQQFVRAALSRPGTDQSRHTYPLVIDELQVFIGKEGDSSDIQTAITQLRGLGIAGIYAHQSLSQLGQMQAEMLQNSGSRIMLRTQEPDASIYARYYAASGITANDIAGQDANEHQYAALHCDNERTGLFSMQVLPWPTPCLPVVVPDERTDWRLLTPPDSPDPAFDQELVQLVYFPVAHPAELVRELADYDDALWQWTLARWEAIRRFQRQYVLAHPGCVALDERIVDPDPAEQAVRRTAQQRLDRQRWLSRLLVATPRILAAAEYARIRRAIEPEASPSRARPVRSYEPPGFSAGRALPAPTSTGYVDGAAQPGERPPPIRSGDQKTVEQVLRERGQRRRRDTLAPGYDDADGLGLFDTSTTAAHPSSHTISESEGE